MNFFVSIFMLLHRIRGEEVTLRDEKEESEQTVLIVELANQLDTSEFEIFLRSYREFYSADAINEKVLKRIEFDFKRYLLEGEIPHYVRIFLTKIQRRNANGA